MCFTALWFHEGIPDFNPTVAGFHSHQADRDCGKRSKKEGGGVALFVNNKWCNAGHVMVKERFCSPDIELLAMSLGPYYLPREFICAIIIVVYFGLQLMLTLHVTSSVYKLNILMCS